MATAKPIYIEDATREQLIAQIELMFSREEINEANNELFDEWTDDFFKLHGLEHLIEPYHNYIADCLDQEDEDEH
jgi:hypothetical protein